MALDKSFIESLLYEEEGVSFDAKCAQYKFIKATDDEKSELLKDILSFCNTWRRDDAYIFIGAKEVKGGKNELCGVDHFIDDAQVQQFVNGKTQRPVEFSFINCKHNGFDISIIHIPVQQRPIHLRNDYGKLRKNVVYIKRGSSSGEASPEEIIQMGKDVDYEVKVTPDIIVSLLTSENGTGNDVSVQSSTVLDPEAMKAHFSSLVIPKEEIDLVLRNKAKLDSIEDRYPDGQEFYPFKVSNLTDFCEKIDRSLRLITEDFDRFCKLNNLFFRSFELSDSHAAALMKERGIIPHYGHFRISNNGTCPSGNMVIYIKSNEHVKFLSLTELFESSLDVGDMPTETHNIIEKARELERGQNKPITTMYERVNGYKYLHWHGIHSPPINSFKTTPIIVSKIKNSNLVIDVNNQLMHNHSIDIKCEGIYLCPMISDGGRVEVEYEVHASNLPVPKRGFIVINGKNF